MTYDKVSPLFVSFCNFSEFICQLFPQFLRRHHRTFSCILPCKLPGRGFGKLYREPDVSRFRVPAFHLHMVPEGIPQVPAQLLRARKGHRHRLAPVHLQVFPDVPLQVQPGLSLVPLDVRQGPPGLLGQQRHSCHMVHPEMPQVPVRPHAGNQVILVIGVHQPERMHLPAAPNPFRNGQGLQRPIRPHLVVSELHLAPPVQSVVQHLQVVEKVRVPQVDTRKRLRNLGHAPVVGFAEQAVQVPQQRLPVPGCQKARPFHQVLQQLLLGPGQRPLLQIKPLPGHPVDVIPQPIPQESQVPPQRIPGRGHRQVIVLTQPALETHRTGYGQRMPGIRMVFQHLHQQEQGNTFVFLVKQGRASFGRNFYTQIWT